MAELSITLATSRAAGGPAKVMFFIDAIVLRICVCLDFVDRHEVYAAELWSSSGATAWRAEVLSAAEGAGALTLDLVVFAKVLSAGTYELAVRAGGEDLGFVFLEVCRGAMKE